MSDTLKQAVITLLENNGGPIDGEDEEGNLNTDDGKDYVMVRREDFERLEALIKNRTAMSEPRPVLKSHHPRFDAFAKRAAGKMAHEVANEVFDLARDLEIELSACQDAIRAALNKRSGIVFNPDDGKDYFMILREDVEWLEVLVKEVKR